MSSNLIKIFRSFSRNECLIFLSAFLIFIISGIFLGVDFIDKKTKEVAVAGGEYREGIVGQPTFVNPILVGGNEVDRDLTEILFSNVLDMALNYKVSQDGKIWDVRLRNDLAWDDGEPITSDDVIFTIQSIENPDSRSSLQPIWQGIIAQRVSELEFKLILPTIYSFFLNDLKELRPIPKHIYGSLPPANFRLSNYNLEPVASGAFKFGSFKKRNDGFITQYNLVRNNIYFGSEKPYLEALTLKFYENQKDLVDAINLSSIDGAGGLAPANLDEIGIGHKTYRIPTSRYYAVFFNQYANPALADKNVRLALIYSVDKNEIIKKIFNNYALPASGPMVPGMEGYASQVYPRDEFSADKANQILDLSNWQKGKDGVRQRDLGEPGNGSRWMLPGEPAPKSKPGVPQTAPTRLEFNLIVPQSQFLIDTANILKDDWARIGVKLNIQTMPSEDINNNALRTRAYEMIIFGNIFGNNPDLFSFWHSSEKFYPGLNLALYDNKVADSFIDSTRRDLNPKARQVDFSSLQSTIIGDAPALFLYSPYYIYAARSWFQGFNENFIVLPSYRFQNVSEWYVKTAREWR